MSSVSIALNIFPFCLFGILAAITARQGRAGALGRNHQFGFRTSQTQKSDAAWYAAHRAAAPVSQAVAVTAFLLVGVLLVLVLVHAESAALWVVVGGYLLVIGGFLGAGAAAHRAAGREAAA